MNKEADLGGSENTVADFVRFFFDSSNETQLEITAPLFAIAQNVIVTLTGELAVHNGETINATASFDLNYYFASEIDTVQSIINQKPAFEKPLASSYVFDLAENVDLIEDLGLILDFEGDEFTTEIKNRVRGILLTNESGSYVLSVSKESIALPGSY